MRERLSKHSYLLSKQGSWLCSLAQDQNHNYGEIVYGERALEDVKKVCFGNVCYYKYWQLEGEKKKLTGVVGQSTPYDYYYQAVSALYPENVLDHEIFGKIFCLSSQNVAISYAPVPYKDIDNSIVTKVCEKLSKLWGIRSDDLRIGGSVLVDRKQIDSNDLDVVIFGKNNTEKVTKWLSRATNTLEYREILSNGKSHHRRFLLDGIHICPFASCDNDSWFEEARHEKLDSKKNVEALVVDSSGSLFSPSVYKLEVGNETRHLVSYFVGHTFLFRKGMKIKFFADLFRFEKDGLEKMAFVIPFQGSWVEIL